MARQPLRSRTRNMRTSTGRGTSPSPPRHGATEGVTIALAAKRQGAAATRSQQRTAIGLRHASQSGRRRAVKCRAEAPFVRIAQDGRAARHVPSQTRRHAGQRKRSCRAASSPGRAGRLPAPAPRRGRCRAVERCAHDRARRRAVPATPTPSGSSSSGSTWLPSMPRNSTPIGCRPRSVFRNRPPSRTVRSPPSTRAHDSSRASSTCRTRRDQRDRG